MSGTHVALALLAVCVSLAAAQKPNFCRQYDCPSYSTTTDNADWKLRAYDASSWVGFSKTASSVDKAADGMFMTLFRYIGGANADGAKISMTVPVATKITAVGGGNFRATMMFYLKTNSPPAPTESGVEIISMPAKNVYIRNFYTWFTMADSDRFLQEADSLRADLDAAGAAYDTSSYYQVGYASPWWPLKKYQEVWLDSA